MPSKKVCRQEEITVSISVPERFTPYTSDSTREKVQVGNKRSLAQRLEGFDALGSSGMTRQNTAAIAVAAQQPGQGIGHGLF